jgi:hypothetical protein
MKQNKKKLLDKIGKLAKKSSKFESKVLNIALQKLDSGDYILEGHLVYTADKKQLVYVLGDKTSVIIPEGIEVIGDKALTKKKNLQEITLPTTLRKIGRDAFCDCDALKTIVIPASVERISAYAFADCDSLKSVHFESLPKELNRKAFDDCEKLHEIYVHANGISDIRKALHIVDDETDCILVASDISHEETKHIKGNSTTNKKLENTSAKAQKESTVKK